MLSLSSAVFVPPVSVVVRVDTRFIPTLGKCVLTTTAPLEATVGTDGGVSNTANVAVPDHVIPLAGLFWGHK